ncbi:MAG: putative two-component system response regulator [Planctomycetota bacterium]
MPPIHVEFEVTERKRVLFVDDEQGLLDALRRVLHSKRKEWDMTFAQGVDAAIEALEAHPFDTVVSDIKMPGRDGFDLLRTIRDHPDWKAIPVVILTGNGESDLKRRALDLGATDLLGKPVDPDDLTARIRSVLRIKAYDDEIKAQNHILEDRVRERTAQLERAQVELIWRLGKAGEFRDSDTGYHVVRVGFYSRTIAHQLELDQETQRQIFLTAPLHDLGKIGVPDSILLKPEKLSANEWVMMRQHTVIGAHILRDEGIAQDKIARLSIPAPDTDCEEINPLTELAATIAECHHERWDGGGYPHGIAGEDIPIAARITSVADVYDALCSKRPYKDPFTPEQVLELINNGDGCQFDPMVIEAFHACLPDLIGIQNEFVDEPNDHAQADVIETVEDLRRAS